MMTNTNKTNGVHQHNGASANGSYATVDAPVDRPSSVTCDEGTAAYTVHDLTRKNQEEAATLLPLSGTERIETIHRWLALGAVVDRRVGAVADADYLEKEAGRLLGELRSHVERELRVRFDPLAEGSLTRPIVDQVQESKRAIADARQQIAETLRTNFDPNDARSVVGKIGTLLQTLEAQLAVRFDPKRKDSVLGNFDERIEQLMKRLTSPEGPFKTLSDEVHGLRMDLARLEAERAGKQSVIERTAAKADPFEDVVEARLSAGARILRDLVERTGKKIGPGGSKKGDFVVQLANDAGRLVVEAKAGAIKSVPEIRKYMELAVATRNADYALVVVRNAEDMPAQARPFQFYDEGIIVCMDNFDFAYRVARWIVAVQNDRVPENIDAAAAREAVAEIRSALKFLRPARHQLGIIEKATTALEGQLKNMEEQIVEAVESLEESLDSAE